MNVKQNEFLLLISILIKKTLDSPIGALETRSALVQYFLISCSFWGKNCQNNRDHLRPDLGNSPHISDVTTHIHPHTKNTHAQTHTHMRKHAHAHNSKK